MRTVVAICVMSLVLVAVSSAAERAWKTGAWAPRNGEHYVIDAGRDVITADANASTGPIDATPGSAVQFAIDGSTVYVLDAARTEHALTLVGSAPKYASTYAAVGSGHFIRSVAPGGTGVVLEDGSRWDMDPLQHFAVAEWQADDLVSVRRSTSDPDFAYEVVNTSQDDGSLANYRVR